jgi:hypothetical protein
MASAMACLSSAPRGVSATIGAVMTGAATASAVMPGDVMGAALMVAGGALSGAARASVPLAGGHGADNCEEPS